MKSAKVIHRPPPPLNEEENKSGAVSAIVKFQFKISDLSLLLKGNSLSSLEIRTFARKTRADAY